MFIDTHCHANIMVKKDFDVPLSPADIDSVQAIIDKALLHQVKIIINVGTSLVESANCVALTRYAPCYAAVGIHPNDADAQWKSDMQAMHKQWLSSPETIARNKIVAIGEVGLDYHYPHPNKQRQKDLFNASIDVALQKDLAIIIHTRDAGDDTLRVLEQYAHDNLRGVVHCFSEDLFFARHVIDQGLALGIGGTITYPKNDVLRTVCKEVSLDSILLETDAPYLPPQKLRGTPNHPANIPLIAQFLADLRQISLDDIAKATTINAQRIFRF